MHARNGIAKHPFRQWLFFISTLARSVSKMRLRRPPPLCISAIIQASLSEYYGNFKGEGGKPTGSGRSGRAAKRGEEGDMGVLTQVLDLARPVVCALGPLMTHLQVSGAAFLSGHLFPVLYSYYC